MIVRELLTRWGFEVDTGKVERFDQAIGKAKRGAKSAGDSMDWLTGKVKGLLVALASTQLAVAGVGVFREFQDRMSAVAAVSEATDVELRKLTRTAKMEGIRSGLGPRAAAEGLEELSKAGFSANQQVSALPSTLLLARAAGIAVGQASEVVGNTLMGFGKTASETGAVVDILAQAANKSAIGIRDIQYSLRYIAPIAAATSQSLEGVSAALAIMGNQGIRGEQAGTSVRSMLESLINPSTEGAEIMQKLGIQIQDAEGKMLPLAKIIDQLRAKTAKMTQVEKTATITKLVGTSALSGTLALMNTAPEAYQEMIDAMEKSRGAAEKMAKVMNRGLGPAWVRFVSIMQVGAISVLEKLSPALEGVLNKMSEFTEWLMSNPETVEVAKAALEVLKWAIVGLAPGAAVLGLKAIAGIIMTTVIPAVSAFVVASWPIFLISAVITGIVLALQDFVTWMNGGEAALGGWFDLWYNFGYATLEAFQGLATAVPSILQGIADSIMPIWQGLTGAMGAIWSGLFGALGHIASQAIQGIIAKIQQVPQAIAQALGGLGGLAQMAARLLPGGNPLAGVTPAASVDQRATTIANNRSQSLKIGRIVVPVTNTQASPQDIGAAAGSGVVTSWKGMWGGVGRNAEGLPAY